MQNKREAEEVVLSGGALRKIEARLRARFRAFLRPGERIRLTVEEEDEFSFAHLKLVAADGSYRLDLEGALIAREQPEVLVVTASTRDRLVMAIEFLSAALNDYFRGQRRERFHPDWRIYPFEGAEIRFRGGLVYPELEAQAQGLLHDDDEDGL